MKGGLKKVLVVLASLMALLVSAAVIVPLVVDVDKYRPQITSAVNEKINGKLELGKLKLSLWGKIRVEVGGLNLTGPQGAKIVSVDDAYFHLPFSSILSGSPSVVLNMAQPKIQVIKNKAGKLNVMQLMKEGPEVKPAPSAPAPTAPQKGGESKPVEIPSIAANARFGLNIRKADLSYQDETTGLVSKVSDLNLAVRDLSLTRTTEIELSADLNTTMGKVFSVKGPARLHGTVKPTLAGKRLEQVAADLKIDLNQLDISAAEMFHKKAGVAANGDIAIRANEREARIEKLDFKFFNAELQSRGVVTNLDAAKSGKQPTVQYSLKSNSIEFGPWVELVPMLKQYELGGSAQLTAEAQGPADKLNYKANFKVADLTAKAPNLKAQPRFNGSVKVATDRLEEVLFTMKAPGNDLKIQGNLVSFTQPRFNFSVTSSGMDLDQLIEFPPPATKAKPEAPETKETAPAKGESKGAPAKTSQQADFDKLLDPLRENKIAAATSGAITIDMKLIKAYNVKMSDIVARLTMKNLGFAVDTFSMKLFGGSIKANAAAQFKPAAPTYRFGVQVAALDLSEAVASQMAFLKNTVLGKANFEMSGEGKSFNPDVAMETLSAKGKMRVDDATFATIDVAKMTTEAITKAIDRIGDKIPAIRNKVIKRLPPGGAQKYEFISSDFTIQNAKFAAPNFVAKAMPDKGIDLKGDTVVGIKDYSLKTRWELIDTYNLTGARDLSVEEKGVLVEHILAEGNGPVRFPVSAGCTIMAPCYSYTEVPEFLAKVALNNVQAALTGKAKAEVRKQAEDLIKKAPVPPGVQDKFKGFGKKLFGR